MAGGGLVLLHSSVPGLGVPGMAVPGLDGTGAGAQYQYLGHVQAYYLDYLDVLTQKTLSAVPGGFYSMVPVNSRAGLTVPPPDHSWNPPATFSYRIVLHPRLVVAELPPPAEVLALDALYGAHDALARARIRNISLQAFRASQPGQVQPACGGSPLARAAVPGPPSEGAVALAAARALNAELQAARARGELVTSGR
jgi:hypothetical protein